MCVSILVPQPATQIQVMIIIVWHTLYNASLICLVWMLMIAAYEGGHSTRLMLPFCCPLMLPCKQNSNLWFDLKTIQMCGVKIWFASQYLVCCNCSFGFASLQSGSNPFQFEYKFTCEKLEIKGLDSKFCYLYDLLGTLEWRVCWTLLALWTRFTFLAHLSLWKICRKERTK